MTPTALMDIQQKAQSAANTRWMRPECLEPWVAMPPDGEPFEVQGSIPSPAYGVTTVICTYAVPTGYHAVLKGFLFRFEGSGWTPGDDNIVGALDVNVPIAGPQLSGYGMPGYEQILFPKGSYEQPWPVLTGLRFRENDTLRLKVTTIATVGTGAPNFFNGVLTGWIWPR